MPVGERSNEPDEVKCIVREMVFRATEKARGMDRRIGSVGVWFSIGWSGEAS